ncbi:hypothetical protein ACFZBE_41285 [Streptomyces sp. NPDC008061]|uniref:hypothetical protein n=1 Tax=Streptomyces sp. NPDC008061 TaxID=3364805 RepID=UPI0036ECC808
MIIFDTNAINYLSPDSVTADIIQKLRESGHYRVAVPWMVLEEMAAHQATIYPVSRSRCLLHRKGNVDAVAEVLGVVGDEADGLVWARLQDNATEVSQYVACVWEAKILWGSRSRSR